MDLQAKLRQIIPPDDYEHRRDFSNNKIIDNLNVDERIFIENELLNMLNENLGDILIIQTLAYMDSKKSIPLLEIALSTNGNKLQKIIICYCIYAISKDNRYSLTALEAFKDLTNKWDLVFAFYYLGKFHNAQINQLIEAYTHNPDFLIASNAQEALEKNK